MQKLGSKTFKASLVREGSWGATSLGEHESTMELYQGPLHGQACIAWDIPALEELIEIGLTYEWRRGREYDDEGQAVLTDYDGVMSLPAEAVELLREHGFEVGEEFE